jgi:hypothetical protein
MQIMENAIDSPTEVRQLLLNHCYHSIVVALIVGHTC